MFRRFPIFIQMQEYGQRQTRHGARGIGWLAIAPGLGLICVALAMTIWPDLLAYFVASILLCVGTALTVLGWRMRHIAQDARRPRHRAPPLDRSNLEA
jgi:peptidoglycan/LPS O-acetylase OafA/YrhL